MKIENIKGENQKNKDTTSDETVHNNQHMLSSFSTLPSIVLDWIEGNTSEVFIIWDLKGKALFVSDSVKHVFGYEKSEIIGAYWYELLSTEDVNYIKRNYDKENKKTQEFNIHILNKENKYIWTECAVQNLSGEASDEKLILSSYKDITEKKETEELMIRSEKMSIAGQLAAAIAHEVRNPLTSIKGFLQLLQAGINRKEEYYNIMIDEIEKIETITTELLSISKPNTENRQMESLDDMIKEVVFLLEPQANKIDIDIKLEHLTNEFIFCDRSQIKQVLINIIKNAIEAMDTGGTITIYTEKKQSGITVNIADEGPGVPEEIIQKLGEPFLTTKKNGTGLGLMITKQLLERHEASLHIKQNSDKGSTFQLFFTKN